MVTKIEHNISQTRYTMDMEVVKNSMLTDLPGNTDRYDSGIEEIQEGLDEMGRQGGKTGSRAMRNTDGSIKDPVWHKKLLENCLLYTSDAADE